MLENNNGGVFATALQHNGHLIDAIEEIEQQRDGMRRIEQGVTEIRELFQDMAMLVDLQQETLDVIEHNVTTAVQHTKKAEEQIQNAEDHAKAARKVPTPTFSTSAIPIPIAVSTKTSVLSTIPTTITIANIDVIFVCDRNNGIFLVC